MPERADTPEAVNLSRHALPPYSTTYLFVCLFEWASMALAQFDAETRFLLRSARGRAQRGLSLLDKLDQSARRRAKKAPCWSDPAGPRADARDSRRLSRRNLLVLAKSDEKSPPGHWIRNWRAMPNCYRIAKSVSTYPPVPLTNRLRQPRNGPRQERKHPRKV
jgi:hypothetical protein